MYSGKKLADAGDSGSVNQVSMATPEILLELDKGYGNVNPTKVLGTLPLDDLPNLSSFINDKISTEVKDQVFEDQIATTSAHDTAMTEGAVEDQDQEPGSCSTSVKVRKKATKAKAKVNYAKLICRSAGGNLSKMEALLSGSDGLSESEEIFSHTKLDRKNLAWLFVNLRGWLSKKNVFNNILSSSDFDVVGITETHTNANKMSSKGFRYYCRNRSNTSNSKGGVAVGIKEEVSKYAIKVFEGSGSNECIMVKLTCFKPEVVFGVFYGNQEGTTSPEVIRKNISETLTALDKFKEQGLDIILGGDMNLHVGKAVRDNDPRVSKGGEFLLDLCSELGFYIANNLADGPTHTHYDETSKTSRVLDLVITNRLGMIKQIVVDNDKVVTPYRLLFKDGEPERRYTDHLAIYGESSVGRVRRKRRPKTQMWNYKVLGGKAKFQHETNERAPLAIKAIIEDPDIDSVITTIDGLLFGAKKESFLLRTVTHKKLKRESDERLAVRRLKEIQEMNDVMGTRKPVAERVFLARNRLQTEGDELLEAMDHYKTGVRLETAEEVYDSLMDYNVEVLKKNEVKDEDAARVKEAKREAVEYFKQIETPESENDIEWGDWVAVLTKVTLVNKTCYRDLVLAGHKWQAAMYMLFRRIYREERIPRMFMKTTLKKLYKKKGDKTKLTSYRFIHLKDWAGKVMEKLVMYKCQEKIAAAMPEGQIGGTKKSSCSEHIASIFALARAKASEGSGLALLFVDVKKCFDKQSLVDTQYSAGEAGVHGKPLRVMGMLHDKTVIGLAGDPTGRTEVIDDSTGQGTNWAPLACSLSMGKALNEADDRYDSKLQMGLMRIGPLQYVDDAVKPSETADQARDAGKIFTEALNELGLEAHPEKSALVIMGPKKYRDRMKSELAEQPVMVQGWAVQTSECETYLGAEISEKGVKDSVTRSIKKRIKAAYAKELQLSKLLESDWMDKAGWIEAVKTLFNSIISSTITYASQTYAFMTKTQVNEMESAFKGILYRLLRISKFAHYAAVLVECNMIRVKNTVDQYKITFIRDLVHSKGSGTCLNIMREEERLYPGTGLIAEVQKLCNEYNLQDVTQFDVDKEMIKLRVWEKARGDIWRETLRNGRVPFNRTHVKTPKPYQHQNRYRSQIFFAYRIGELQFKDYRRGEFRKKFGNTKCFAPGCSQPDTLEHVRKCDGYPPEVRFIPDNFNYDPTEQNEFIDYLIRLDAYRCKYFYLPLLYRPRMAVYLDKKISEIKRD